MPKKPAQTTLKAVKAGSGAPKKRAKPDTEDEDSASEVGSLHDDTLLSATPPSAKKQKKDLVPKKKAGKPLQTLANEAIGFDGVAEPKSKKGGNAEQYQKVSLVQYSSCVVVLIRLLAHSAGTYHQAS